MPLDGSFAPAGGGLQDILIRDWLAKIDDKIDHLTARPPGVASNADIRHVGLMTVRRCAATSCFQRQGTRHHQRGLTSNGGMAACEEDTPMIARKTLVQRTAVIAT